MPKHTIILSLVFITYGAFAQKPGLKKTELKKFQLKISYIPAKTFKSFIYTGTDSVSSSKSRMVSVPAFYIGQTEVTNKEYREFVYYVRDSIAHALLQHFQTDNNSIDWKQNIEWSDNRLDGLMAPPEERISGQREIDPAKIVYTIDFYGQQQTIIVYPDTLVWMRDFNYSYNEPLVKKYFSHSFYDNYPVVGVSLKQAMAFCEWKTKQTGNNIIIRLPENAEWESAAIGEKDTSVLLAAGRHYPCNFGTIKGAGGTIIKDLKDDGYIYTAPVKNYPAGDYGLYDIRGNVAEWTSTAIDDITNVEVASAKQKRIFIVKGGGWNSPPVQLQPGACQFYEAAEAHAFVGFRYVVAVRKQ